MEYIKLAVEGNVGVLTVNRPAALNALNDQVIRELNEALDTIDLDTVRCLVVTGEGQKAFVAGADIGQMSGLTKAEGEAFGKLGNDVFRKLETLPIPTIAAVCGFALGGGCELAMTAGGRPGYHPRLRRHPAHGPPHRHGPRQGAAVHRKKGQSA